MSLLILANVAANTALCASAIHLMIRVFGHPNSVIYAKPYAAVLCKIATAITICGAFANILVHQQPPLTEFILNIGVTCNFIWISWFYTIVNHTKTVEKQPRSNGRPKRNVKRR